MHEPEFQASNVHRLNRQAIKEPPASDVMGVLLRELSDARPPDTSGKAAEPESATATVSMPQPLQQAEGHRNLQIGGNECVGQIARGNYNVQIADFRLIVQLGLSPQPTTPSRRRVLKFRHFAILVLLVGAYLC